MQLVFPKPTIDITTGKKIKTRKPFKISTKKKEWNKAAGRDETDFKTTSKCRNCKRKLIWGSGTYDFDHKDNNPTNASQKNCYLVCKVCHGKHTVIKKRKVKNQFGYPTGYQTVKVKKGYKKKITKKRKRKRKKSRPKSLLPVFNPPKIKIEY